MREAGVIPEGTVTVLFTDLVDSTLLNQQLGDEAARAVGRAIERLALERIEAHRGVVIKELGDGLMAAFTSARRAVVCAKEIQQEVSARNRREPGRAVLMRIGLHTGEVLAEDGDIHGETVIIARRIESVAPPGGVLASETVHLLLGTSREELEDRGEFELKGITSKWRLYEVPCGEAPAIGVLPAGALTPFIGRSEERAQLLGAVARVAEGTGGMVLISGEAGAGKSRLASEVVDEARRRRLVVLTGACLDMDVPPPHQPLIDQLEEAVRETSPDRMRAALGENAPEIAMLMPSLRQRFDDIPEAPSLPPEQVRRYVLHGVEEFLQRSARARPLVLLFEDLHWADESTLLLLEHIAPRLASTAILVVGTFRSTDLGSSRPFARSLTKLLRGRTAVEIALHPLSRAELATLVSHRTGRTPPAALVDLVSGETEGNPFFAEELVHHLHESGKLFDEAGEWSAAFELGETEVPRGVALLIGRRVDHLDPMARRLLATAAVLGRVFSFDVLRAVSGASEAQLFDAVEEADAAHLIEEVTGSGEARYGFVHEQIRQTLLGELALPRRQRLHLEAAEALAALPVGGTSAADIAHHFERAGPAAPPRLAAESFVRAGEVALAALAFENALRWLERAAERFSSLDTEAWATTLALQARALRGTGRIADALDALARAASSLAAGTSRRATVLLQRSQLLLDLYRANDTLDDLGAVLAQRRADGDRYGELEALLALGQAAYILSLDDRTQAAAARTTYEEAHAVAVELGDARSIARALVPTVWFSDYWPEYASIARANAERAVELARESGDEDLLIDAEFARVRLLPMREGSDRVGELLLRVEARRDPLRMKELCFWLMWTYRATARFDECIAMCDRGIGLADVLATAPVQYGSIKACALVDAGRFDEVDGAIGQEVTDEAHPFGRAMAALARAELLWAVWALEEATRAAVAAYQQAVDLSRVWMQRWLVSTMTSLRGRLVASGLPVPADLVEALSTCSSSPGRLAQAEVLLLEGAPAEARSLLLPAITALERDRRTRDLHVALLLAGESAFDLGDHESAATTTVDLAHRAGATGHGLLTWKAFAVAAASFEGLGDAARATAARREAERAFAALSRRLTDSSLRAAFESQPWAPGTR